MEKQMATSSLNHGTGRSPFLILLHLFSLNISASTLIAIFASLLISACKASDQSVKESSEGDEIEAAGEDDDDDLDVGIAVPMGLVGPDFLASVQGNLSNANSSSSHSSEFEREYNEARPKEQFALDLISLPVMASGEMKKLIGNIKNLMADINGPDGFFKAKKQYVKEGGAKRYSLNPVNGENLTNLVPVYAILHVRPGTQEYKFVLDLFTQNSSDSTLYQSTRIEFSPNSDQTTAMVKIVHHAADTAAYQNPQVVMVTYDSSKEFLAVEFGKTISLRDRPAKTIVEYSGEFGAGLSTIKGAYVWQAQGSVALGEQPRYQKVKNDDIEVFTMIDNPDKNVAVQATGFLGSENKALAGDANFGERIFTEFSYATILKEYILRVIRGSDFNAACATSGNKFSQAYLNSTPPLAVPAEISALPNNICLDSSSTSQEVVWAAIDRACRDLADIGLTGITVRQADGTIVTLDEDNPYSICSDWWNVIIFSYPNIFDVEGNQRTLLTTLTSYNEDQQQMVDLLGEETVIDLTPLFSIDWPSISALNPDVFAEAEGGASLHQ
jgi:hypothetical protein